MRTSKLSWIDKIKKVETREKQRHTLKGIYNVRKVKKVVPYYKLVCIKNGDNVCYPKRVKIIDTMNIILVCDKRTTTYATYPKKNWKLIIQERV